MPEFSAGPLEKPKGVFDPSCVKKSHSCKCLTVSLTVIIALHIYIYIYNVCLYFYISIEREKERERERERKKKALVCLFFFVCQMTKKTNRNGPFVLHLDLSGGARSGLEELPAAPPFGL